MNRKNKLAPLTLALAFGGQALGATLPEPIAPRGKPGGVLTRSHSDISAWQADSLLDSDDHHSVVRDSRADPGAPAPVPTNDERLPDGDIAPERVLENFTRWHLLGAQLLAAVFRHTDKHGTLIMPGPVSREGSPSGGGNQGPRDQLNLDLQHAYAEYARP
jgi:hypothetical protein